MYFIKLKFLLLINLKSISYLKDMMKSISLGYYIVLFIIYQQAIELFYKTNQNSIKLPSLKEESLKFTQIESN